MATLLMGQDETLEDDDMHMCLRCGEQISGLYSYILHRKTGCVKQHTDRRDIANIAATDASPAITAVRPDAMVTPMTIRASLATENETLEEFFQSLELQRQSSHGGKDSTERHGEILDFINSSGNANEKDLPIASIFNMLEFSSDDNDLFEAEEAMQSPPQNHTRGKWKTRHVPIPQKKMRCKGIKRGKTSLARDKQADDGGTELEKGKKQTTNEQIVSASTKCTTRWRGKLGTSLKSSQDGEMSDTDDGDDVPMRYNCTDGLLDGERGDDSRLDENDKNDDSRMVKAEEVFNCKVCERNFTNKYTAARHFISDYHNRLALNHPDRVTMFQQYHSYLLYFSAFQCRICRFYCNTSADLQVHVASASHVTEGERLLGPAMCVGCKFSATTNSDLLAHIRSSQHSSRHGKSKACIIKEQRYRIKCKFCGNTQHSIVHMKRHIMSKHKSSRHEVGVKVKTFQEAKREFSCESCSYSTRVLKELQKHSHEQHSAIPFQCKPCGLSFSSFVTLQQHLKTFKHLKMDRAIEVSFNADASNAENPLYSCGQCEEAFHDDRSLRIHVSRVHRVRDSTLSDYVCDVCGQKFEDANWLQFHVYSHSFAFNEGAVLRLYEGKDKTTARYRQFLDAIKGVKMKDTVKCPQNGCGKILTKVRVMEHLRSHTGERVFECPLCDKSFMIVKSIQTHVKKHLGLETQTCNVCHKTFHNSNFRSHAQSHRHDIICEICSKTFGSKRIFLSHQMRVHRAKAFVCSYEKCGRRFACKKTLDSHSRTHTGEKPFPCEFCDFHARDKIHLRKHFLRKHQDRRKIHHCEYCDYRSGNGTHLRRHLRIHAGSRPFHCPYCDYSSHTHDNLRKHIVKTKKHAGLFIYKCKFCEFGSNEVKEFRWHVTTNHACDVDLDENVIVSQYTGVYQRGEDLLRPAEGMKIIPVREKKCAKDGRELDVLTCVYCSYRCKNQQTMDKHLQTANKKHPPLVSFTCKLCEFVAIYGDDLHAHMQKVHLMSDDDCVPFPCAPAAVMCGRVPIMENIQGVQHSQHSVLQNLKDDGGR